ncbi:MAG: VOC family protein [Chloroflexi bacterium]|nr:VOC family protein [Chloroflexota bacterium]MBK6326424.1 VOC family protein [Chloroflexota bacterium]MBP7045970.1 VOC family protein [Chloroflexota bacterium]
MAVNSFRVALTVADFDRAVAFYRDGLGLEPGELWTDNGRGQMFGAEQASLEIFDPDYAAGVDQIEVGERVSGQIRFAFEVADVRATMARALQYGATLVHEPVLTPWGDLNVRLRSPEGLQITLFQTSNEVKNGEPEEGNE